MSYYEKDEALAVAYNTLRQIANWDLPKVIYKNGQLSSYGSAYGSNGERDYIKTKAADAIAEIEEIKSIERKAFNVTVDDVLQLKTDWYDQLINYVDMFKSTNKAHRVVITDGYGNRRPELERYVTRDDNSISS